MEGSPGQRLVGVGKLLQMGPGVISHYLVPGAGVMEQGKHGLAI